MAHTSLASRARQPHTTDLVFTLGLFCVFAASAFLLVMIGIRAYQSTVTQLGDTYATRTALSYVVEKVRRHDTAGAVELGEMDGRPALVLHDTLADTEYLTYIYADDTALYELTVRGGTAVNAELGDAVLEVSGFTMRSTSDGFLALSAQDSAGGTMEVLLHLRSAPAV